MTGLAVGDEVEVEIGPIGHGGHWIARHDGQVLFVRHTATGERVRARVTELGPGGRFVRADAVAVLEASPDRVAPPCPYAGTCGGCDFQHLALPAQRKLKTLVVQEQFRRLAGLEVDVDVAALDPREDGLRWRSRCEFTVDAAGRAGMRAHRSEAIVPLDDCLIASQRVVGTGVLQREWPPGSTLDVVAPSAGEPVVCVLPGTDPVPTVTERVGAAGFAHDFAVSARGFWQVHPRAPHIFVERVLAEVVPRPGERALDLYAGVGLFAAALADAVGPEGQVLTVESDAVAGALARSNLTPWPHAVAVANRVDDFLGVARPARRGPDRRRASRPRRPRPSPLLPPSADVVVLDPPRTGAGPKVVEAVAGLRPRWIAYVACDPAALARDTVALGAAAYDAFPMTHHVECIATFTPSP